MFDYYLENEKFTDMIWNQTDYKIYDKTGFNNFSFDEYLLEPYALNLTYDYTFEFNLSQLKTPIFYILSIIFIYIVIVTVVFLSAILSNRKRDYLYDTDDENSLFCIKEEKNFSDNESVMLLDDFEQETSSSNTWLNFLPRIKHYKPVRLEKVCEYSI